MGAQHCHLLHVWHETQLDIVVSLCGGQYTLSKFYHVHQVSDNVPNTLYDPADSGVAHGFIVSTCSHIYSTQLIM